MKKDILKYKITIDDEYAEDGEDLGIAKIAYTKNPAILVKGMAFKSSEPILKFFSDDLKHRIVAPAMIPMDIYRNDEFGEYYVQFTEEEIAKIHSKFMKNLNGSQLFNLEHNNDITVPAYILECWIVENPSQDKAYTTYGIEVPKGTVMLTTQITDEEVYKELVKNNQIGYSIEGFLGMAIGDIINNKLNKNNMKENKLPAGLYTSGNKTFSVKEDGTFEIIEKEVEMASIEIEGIGTLTADQFEIGSVVTNGEELGSNLSFTYEGFVYRTDAEGVIVSKDEFVEEIIEEEVFEEVKEEVVTEEVIEEEKELFEDVIEEVVENYSKEEIDAKFDELYKMIADFNAKKEVVEVVEEKKDEVFLSANERLSAFNQYMRKQKYNK